MLTKFTNQDIEQAIDYHLSKMFNPKIVVPDAIKDEIKRYSKNLIKPFISIIDLYNSGGDSDKYVDALIHRIDTFIAYLDSLFRSESDKHIACSVGLIYNSLFLEAQSQLKEDLLDKMYFEYGEQKIRNIIMEKLKK